MEEKLIGRITHYFGKIGVGVIELSQELNVGDTIHVVGGDRDFTQVVTSMQVEHQEIPKAKAREAIGLKLDGAAKGDDKVFKVIG